MHTIFRLDHAVQKDLDPLHDQPQEHEVKQKPHDRERDGHDLDRDVLVRHDAGLRPRVEEDAPGEPEGLDHAGVVVGGSSRRRGVRYVHAAIQASVPAKTRPTAMTKSMTNWPTKEVLLHGPARVLVHPQVDAPRPRPCSGAAGGLRAFASSAEGATAAARCAAGSAPTNQWSSGAAGAAVSSRWSPWPPLLVWRRGALWHLWPSS